MFFVLVTFLDRALCIIIHLARNAEKGGGVLMSITVPKLKHSFIIQVPVPVPDPVPVFRVFHTPLPFPSPGELFTHDLQPTNHPPISLYKINPEVSNSYYDGIYKRVFDSICP